ncbi:MAG TPA: HIT domain-containing protein [Candidatus Nanoarchaeia archaeon]|nr:HIT domain-containing protein [Candidatus Nanoarchaeia archaeon]
MPEDQCIFCHIAQGAIPAKKVFEDDKVIAVLDINPAVSGHILLLPKEHVAVMPQMKDELVTHIGMVAKQLSAALIRSMKVEGTSIFVANGAAAGQRAPHFMLHIMPRVKSDGVKLDLPEGKIDEKTTSLVFSKLAPAAGKQLGFEVKPGNEAKKEETQELQEQKNTQEVKDGKTANLEKEKLQKQEPARKFIQPDSVSPKKEIPKAKGALDDIADFLTSGGT